MLEFCVFLESGTKAFLIYLFMVSVLVSCGCCNAWPQTWRLRTREMYSLTVQRPVPHQFHWAKIRVWAGLPLQALGETWSLPLPAGGSGVPCLRLHPSSLCLSYCVWCQISNCPSLIRALVMAVGAHLGHQLHLKICNLITPPMTLFFINEHLQIPD